ncbi:MAG TPA: hypothetical protein VJ653_00960 [Acidimicrobiales bacterium]|nr:hypothetical protein [Acidimicrobiales bacterium]
MPSLSRTARHFFPLASLVKVTPGAGLTLLPLPLSSPIPTSSPSSPVTRSDELLPRVVPLRSRSAGDSEPPVDGPAGPAVGVVVGAGPAVEPAGCGAAAVCGAGVESVTVAGWATEVVPAGVVVLVESGFTAAGATVVGGVVVSDCRTASDGFDPPLPLSGTVVVGAGWAAVVVAGAAVVGVVAGATVVGVVLATVPWDWVPAAPEGPGAACAEAGPACSTRKSPARSAKAAAHRRGFTTSSILLLLLIRAEPTALGRLRARRPWGRCRDGRSKPWGARPNKDGFAL